MTSKLTREENVQAVFDLKAGYTLGLADVEILKRVARMALAAMDSEPNRNPVLAYADSYRDMAKQGVESVPIWSVITDLERNIAPLYRHAQPAPERDQVRSEHAEWSQATFGNVGPIGPLKHLSKEALEAAAEPGDLSEWADMQFLLWDAQRRAGITDEQITQAMIEKLAVNKQRDWPEPKDGEPRLHIKEQPAPVVQESSDPRDAFEAVFPMPKHAQRCGDGYAVTSYGAWTAYEFVKKWEGWNACRAAMLQAGNSPVIPDSARDALGKALAAMEFMGDTLNNLDAVCSEDVEFVTPAFDAVRRALAAAPQEVPDEK